MPGGDDLVMNMTMKLGAATVMASDAPGGMYSKPQGFAAIFADGFLMQANFYADADIGIIADCFRRAFRVRKAELEQLSRRIQYSVLSEGDETQHASL